jgi:hypothetical protein
LSLRAGKCWLPTCNRLRTRPGRVESEIYFRIVHVVSVRRNSAPVAVRREQTVEIALGPENFHTKQYSKKLGSLTL